MLRVLDIGKYTFPQFQVFLLVRIKTKNFGERVVYNQGNAKIYSPDLLLAFRQGKGRRILSSKFLYSALCINTVDSTKIFCQYSLTSFNDSGFC